MASIGWLNSPSPNSLRRAALFAAYPRETTAWCRLPGKEVLGDFAPGPVDVVTWTHRGQEPGRGCCVQEGGRSARNQVHHRCVEAVDHERAAGEEVVAPIRQQS